MKNTIERSQERAIAWGILLVETFREMGITDNEVIRNCHVGRARFYRMKHGELINLDAYLRMTDYALLKISDEAAPRIVSYNPKTQWELQLWELLFGSHED